MKKLSFFLFVSCLIGFHTTWAAPSSRPVQKLSPFAKKLKGVMLSLAKVKTEAEASAAGWKMSGLIGPLLKPKSDKVSTQRMKLLLHQLHQSKHDYSKALLVLLLGKVIRYAEHYGTPARKAAMIKQLLPLIQKAASQSKSEVIRSYGVLSLQTSATGPHQKVYLSVLRQPGSGARLNALNALLAQPVLPQALYGMLASLLKDPSWKVKATVFLLLQKMKLGAFPLLAQVLSESQNKHAGVQARAVGALSGVAGSLLARLRQALQSKNMTTRVLAAMKLVQLQVVAKGFEGHVSPALTHQNPRIRLLAAKAIASYRDMMGRNVGSIWSKLLNDKHPGVRQVARQEHSKYAPKKPSTKPISTSPSSK